MSGRCVCAGPRRYNTRMPIKRLPSLLVNQIAAGEVVERPASVVKELVENAIDAGATRIDIAIEQGGKSLIRVTDNGSGMSNEQLPLAVAPHATSKIESADDLEAIATLGFRGEALASIGSVSHMSILSRSRDAENAAIIETEGETIGEPRPAGGPVGTTITVRNLFFNTPARRKFMRTDQTEATRIRETVDAFAMSHPAIGWTLRVDDRLVTELPAEQSPMQRVLDVVGRELQNQLLELDVNDRGIYLRGLVGTPDLARPTSKHLRVFLNGRLISDRTINHAVREAYRGLIEPSRHPTAMLFLTMDPAMVDVNVHPTKSEVRFRQQNLMHGAVHAAVRDRLRQADLTPGFDLQRTEAGRLALPPMPAPEFGAGREQATLQSHESVAGGPQQRESNHATRAFVDYFRQLDPKQKGFVYSEVKQALERDNPEMLAESRESSQSDHNGAESADHDLPIVRQAINALQVHSSFIVTEDEQGLVIIDQHALHERVLFEKFHARMNEGALESQRLLMPATLEVDQHQLEALEQLQTVLQRLGIDAEPMGPKTIAIHAFTSLLFERNVDPSSFMQELLGKAAEGDLTNDTESAIHEVLDMMACKAAVKAGDRLPPDELNELLKYRESVERSSNCPHGRPTSLRLTIKDLEKQFGRR